MRHKLDPKYRVAIPSDWRAAQTETLYLLMAKHENRYNIIKCFTESAFSEKIANIRATAAEQGYTLGQIDNYVGNIICSCSQADVSAQGKLLISKGLREHLDVIDYVYLVGKGDHFEIWLPSDYEEAHAPEKLMQNPMEQLFRIFT